MQVASHFATAVIAVALSASLSDSRNSPRVGDAYEITLTRDSSQEGSTGSASSSHDKDTIIERVVSVHPDRPELEYDAPEASTEANVPKDWKLPARILIRSDREFEVLNRSELEGRVDLWLKGAKWTRAVCGRWIFTWNAFRIECDPQAVIAIVKAFDLRSQELRAGALYKDPIALTPGTMSKSSISNGGYAFAVQSQVDPEVVRRSRADSDLVVAEILQKPVTLEAALAKRAKEAVTGTVSVRFETYPNGSPYRRIRATRLLTRQPDGATSVDTVTEILERRPLVAGTS